MWLWCYDPVKYMRRQCSSVGWAVLAYLGIMNGAVLVMMIAGAFGAVLLGMDAQSAMEFEMAISGWGYFLAIGIGLAVLLVWKKPCYMREVIFRKGRPMQGSRFFGLLSVFMSAQLVAILLSLLTDFLLGQMGITRSDTGSVSTDSWSMFLYVGLGAPIAEEILFRGLVLRSLEPFGKRFSIVVSSVLFGLFHGNMSQAPFAILVGLVLAYVTLEYNIVWAMVLHMFNNLIVSDTLTRVGELILGEWGALLTVFVILGFSLAALVAVVLWRKKIGAYWRSGKGVPKCAWACFSSAGMIVLLIILVATIVFVELTAIL